MHDDGYVCILVNVPMLLASCSVHPIVVKHLGYFECYCIAAIVELVFFIAVAFCSFVYAGR